MQKNVAGQKIGAQLVSATDGSAFTGSVTVYVTGDAGTQAVGSVGSGACAHEGEGYHTYAPAQAETNYDLIAFTFKGTGAVPVTVQVYTRVDANVLTAAGTAWNSGAITEASFATTAGSFIPLGIIDQGTAQSATSTTVRLRAGATFAADDIKDSIILVKGSTQDRWQTGRICTDYDAGTKDATVDPAFTTPPTGTISYIVVAGAADLSTPPAVNVTQISGDSAAADNLEAVLDGTGGVTLVADLTGNIDGAVSVASALGSGSVNADALAADAVSEIWSAGTRTLTAGTNIVLAKGTGITGFNDLSAAQVESEVNDALVALHLDHLLATDYDPASKPGVATALLNELVENDGGVSRFTTNALEQGPGGGGSGSFPGTADEWTALKTILGVPNAGTTPEDPTAGVLDTIRDDTNELQTDWANGGRLDLLLDAVLADTGTDGVVLSSSTLNAIADALLDRAAGVEANRTPRQALRLILAAAAGKSSGAGTGTMTYRDTNDTVNRIVATATDGNRTAVTLNAS